MQNAAPKTPAMGGGAGAGVADLVGGADADAVVGADAVDADAVGAVVGGAAVAVIGADASRTPDAVDDHQTYPEKSGDAQGILGGASATPDDA